METLLSKTKPGSPSPTLDHPAERDNASKLRFRNFQVLPGERLLLRDGAPVELGSRAFDLLLVLLTSRGAVVSKNDIVHHVWPSTLVDESNLRFQMACLRRALGDDRDVIKTIQGRGYLFVSEVNAEASEHPGPLDISSSVLEGRQSRASAPRVPRRSDQPALVAVIDDDDDTREALDGLLRSSGLQVESFPHAQAFMDAGHLDRVECLVLDVWLPGRSGLEFQTDLARVGLALPIIFISGHADIHMSVRAMKAGAVEFLTKPVRHEDLLSAIHAAVAAGRGLDATGVR